MPLVKRLVVGMEIRVKDTCVSNDTRGKKSGPITIGFDTKKVIRIFLLWSFLGRKLQKIGDPYIFGPHLNFFWLGPPESKKNQKFS
jgi:hypothetical protein